MAVKNIPHESNFALGMVLLKLKPSGIDIEEFIHAIRHSLLPGSNKQANPRGARLDTAMFWKHLFMGKTLQNEQQGSLIVALETQLDDVQTSSQNTKNLRKRKDRGGDAVPKENTKSKRLKLDVFSDTEIIGKDECDEGNNYHTQTLRVIRRLAQILRSNDGSGNDKENLAYLMRHACSLIIESTDVSAKEDTSTELRDTGSSHLQEHCQVAQSIWLILVRCICKLQSTDMSSDFAGNLVPIAVSVFRCLLVRLHQYCLDEAADRLRSLGKPPHSTNGKDKTQEHLKKTVTFNNTCNSLSQLLTHILASTKYLQETCPSFCEGIACIFLDNLGMSMSYHLFGSSNDMSNGFVAHHGSIDDVDMSDERITLAMQLEAPHLIRILRGLMRAQKHEVADSRRRPSVGQFSPASFAANTLRKLQNTVLRGMFGDEDKTFVDALKCVQPEVSESRPEVDPIQPGESDQDWFLGEVWETLGWDVLLTRSPNCDPCPGQT